MLVGMVRAFLASMNMRIVTFVTITSGNEKVWHSFFNVICALL